THDWKFKRLDQSLISKAKSAQPSKTPAELAEARRQADERQRVLWERRHAALLCDYIDQPPKIEVLPLIERLRLRVSGYKRDHCRPIG
ncbi:MAG: hypothetical protein AAB817_01970, partial [Patescibacteria group bacterium]